MTSLSNDPLRSDAASDDTVPIDRGAAPRAQAEAQGAARRLWPLLGSDDPKVAGDAWLRILAGKMPSLTAAALRLRRGRSGLETVAQFPEANGPDEGLAVAVEAALAKKAGVARVQDGRLVAAYPFILEDVIVAVAAVTTDPRDDPAEVLNALRWGGGWLKSYAVEQARKDDIPNVKRAQTALGLMTAALEEEGFLAAARRVATELAQFADCDRVSIAFRRFGQSRVAAISHTAQFGRRMDLVRNVEAAMDEAIDQQATILHPAPEGSPPHIDRDHERLLRATNGAHILTIPIFARDRFLGAFTYERMAQGDFDQSTIDLLDAAGALAGPVLEERRANDRWIWLKAFDSLVAALVRLLGPGHLKLKLVVAVLVVLGAILSQVQTTYHVSAAVVLEGSVQRTLVAPFDGYVIDALRRAGDTVSEDETIARLDDRELTLERLNWESERTRRQLEFEQALGLRDRTQMNMLRPQIDQAEAQIELLDGQIARAVILAPFDGVIVAGDLSQAIGASVARGETLFQIAPLDDYRVAMWVDEAQIDDVAEGSDGIVLLSALPTQAFPVKVTRITPVAEVRNGRNMFRVEAALSDRSSRLRPGMNGIGKIDAGERLAIWTWTRTMIDWVRLRLWQFSG